jgi:hypothetical protein
MEGFTLLASQSLPIADLGRVVLSTEALQTVFAPSCSSDAFVTSEFYLSLAPALLGVTVYLNLREN